MHVLVPDDVSETNIVINIASLDVILFNRFAHSAGPGIVSDTDVDWFE